MTALQIWKKPRRPLPYLYRANWDDTNTPYATTRLAFRPCATGTLRIHAARTWLGYGGKGWHALVLRMPDEREKTWFYRDEALCRQIYAEWAGHGDPYGFDFSYQLYSQDRPEISFADVLKHSNPLVVLLPKIKA